MWNFIIQRTCVQFSQTPGLIIPGIISSAIINQGNISTSFSDRIFFVLLENYMYFMYAI